jgi:hypothetical protein
VEGQCGATVYLLRLRTKADAELIRQFRNSRADIVEIQNSHDTATARTLNKHQLEGGSAWALLSDFKGSSVAFQTT